MDLKICLYSVYIEMIEITEILTNQDMIKINRDICLATHNLEKLIEEKETEHWQEMNKYKNKVDAVDHFSEQYNKENKKLIGEAIGLIDDLTKQLHKSNQINYFCFVFGIISSVILSKILSA